jgi:hypothetical protein
VTRSFLAGLSMALASCVSRPAAAPAVRSGESVVASGPVVAVQRTACFGACPVYTISASASGKVTYEGKANVRHIGTATGQISEKQIASLLREMEDAGYFTFADRYAMSEPTCRRYTTDSPSVISSATFRGRTKRVEHDYGCVGAPGALTLLEQKIDEVLGSRQWTGK